MTRKKKPSRSDVAFLNGFLLGHLLGEAEASQERMEKLERYAENLLVRADAAINAARREIGLPEQHDPGPIEQANTTIQ